jgi:acyl carrier protein
MQDDNIVDQIAEFIRQVRREPELVIDQHTEIATLGVDSLDFVELLFMIEENFAIDVPFNANTDDGLPFTTVGSAADAVRSLIVAKSAAA